MENIVDTHFLLTTIVGAHNAFATLFEAVDEVAKHGLIDIGIGHVVEVATDNTGIVGRLDEVGYHISLTGTHGHAAGIVAIDKADEGIVLDRTALELVLGHVMEGAVETGGLQVGVEHTHNTTVDIDVGPHGTIVGRTEIDGLVTLYGIAAIDDHIAATCGGIGEVAFVAVGVELVATHILIFLDTEDIYILTLHLGQDIQRLEA